MKEALKLALEAYLCREMPAGTVIGDPKWWAPKIAAATKEALAQPEQEPVALAQQVMGCFHAAEIEGLTAALANTTDEHLKDLVERRLMHALYAAQEVERNSR